MSRKNRPASRSGRIWPSVLSQPAVPWTIAPILSELPKDFLFHAEGLEPTGGRTHPLAWLASPRAAQHGYEVMTKSLGLLIDPRTFIRVISSILARIIEGLMVNILQLGLRKRHAEVHHARNVEVTDAQRDNRHSRWLRTRSDHQGGRCSDLSDGILRV